MQTRTTIVGVLGLALLAVWALIQFVGAKGESPSLPGFHRRVLEHKTPAELRFDRLPRAEAEQSHSGGSEAITKWIQVLDAESGAPVGGVEFHIRGEDGNSLLRGMTNNEGTIPTSATVNGAIVECVSDGYIGVQVDLRGRAGEIQVELERATRVFGTLEDYWGFPAPAGVLVIARRISGQEFEWESLRPGGFHCESEVVVTRTDNEGRFELTRLDPALEYRVRALAPDIVSEVLDVRGNDLPSSLRLRGGNLRAVTIALADKADGGPIRVSPVVTGQGVGIRQSFAPAPSTRSSPVEDEALVHCGVPSRLVNSPGDYRSWLLTSVVGFRELGPSLASITIALPGYEVAESQIELRRIDASGVSSQTVELTPTGIGFGAVRVGLNPSAGESEDLKASSGLLSILRLVPISRETAPSAWLDFPLRLDVREQVLDGIPSGEYQAFILSAGGLARISSGIQNEERLSVFASDTVESRFDISRLASCAFVLSDSAGSEFNGRFSGVLRMHVAERTQETSFYFPGPPYTFIGLPEGEYSLMVDPPVMFPRPADPASAGAKFRVGPETAGIVHDLEVVF